MEPGTLRITHSLNSVLERWLPEQRLFLKSDRSTRFLRLRPATQLLAWLAMRFEVNFSECAILGMVGAGGIGTPMIFAIQTRNWPRVGIILLGIVVMVLLIDTLSEQLRKKLI